MQPVLRLQVMGEAHGKQTVLTAGRCAGTPCCTMSVSIVAMAQLAAPQPHAYRPAPVSLFAIGCSSCWCWHQAGWRDAFCAHLLGRDLPYEAAVVHHTLPSTH